MEDMRGLTRFTPNRRERDPPSRLEKRASLFKTSERSPESRRSCKEGKGKEGDGSGHSEVEGLWQRIQKGVDRREGRNIVVCTSFAFVGERGCTSIEGNKEEEQRHLVGRKEREGPL